MDSLTVIPAEAEGMQGEKIGQIGVQLAFEKSFIKTLQYGFVETYNTTKMIVTNLAMLITGQFSIDMLAGPVGIYDLTDQVDRKSTRLNSSHVAISYAVFCLKKK